jgi:hypothetical protein
VPLLCGTSCIHFHPDRSTRLSSGFGLGADICIQGHFNPSFTFILFFMAKLHYTNKLANLLCNITNELVGASGKTSAQQVVQLVGRLVLPRAQDHLRQSQRPSKLANKLAQWSLSANKFYNKFVSGATCWPTCSYSGV